MLRPTKFFFSGQINLYWVLFPLVHTFGLPSVTSLWSPTTCFMVNTFPCVIILIFICTLVLFFIWPLSHCNRGCELEMRYVFGSLSLLHQKQNKNINNKAMEGRRIFHWEGEEGGGGGGEGVGEQEEEEEGFQKYSTLPFFLLRFTIFTVLILIL